MKPADFLYHRPTTVKAALQLLAEYDGEARLLAGGQSLMPMMNMRLVRASAVIDINRIPDLDTITINDDGSAVLGALVRYSSAEAHKGLAAAQPLLVKAITHVGDRQVRNRGTLVAALPRQTRRATCRWLPWPWARKWLHARFVANARSPSGLSFQALTPRILPTTSF